MDADRETQETGRVGVVSVRSIRPKNPALSSLFEFEDLILQHENAELITVDYRLSSSAASAFAFRAHNRLGKRTSRVQDRNLAYRPVDLGDRTYDTLFFAPLEADDALALTALRGWRDRCDRAVCWLTEAWAKDLDRFKAHWKILSQFDVIVTSMAGSAERIGELTGRPTTFMAPGTDALVFSPPEPSRDRPVDMWSLGRRSEESHEYLLEAAMADRITYFFDSAQVSTIRNHPQHRFLYASQVQRSRFFIANRSKFGSPEETGGQHEFGGRFFDAAAGGALLLGQFPDLPEFREAFDWEGFGIHVEPGDDPVAHVLPHEDPDARAAQTRAHNRSVANSLMRHDWFHRWEHLLGLADVTAGAGWADRIAALEDRRARFAAEA